MHGVFGGVRRFPALAIAVLSVVMLSSFGQAQDSSNQNLPSAPVPQTAATNPDDLPLQLQPHSSPTVANSPKHLTTDLTRIVVSPVFLRPRDLEWMVPLAGASAAAFATDTHTMRDVVSHDPSFNNTAINVSDGLLGGFIGVPASMFLLGNVTHKDHMRETGILGGEALIDAYVVDEITKLCTFRERPYIDNARGDFYIGKAGVNSSFVSGHSMLSWSSAAVIAGEYHSKWVALAAYSAAAGVSATRVMGQQHFPTDVLIGGAGGWLIGHFVYRAHHHADIPAN